MRPLMSPAMWVALFAALGRLPGEAQGLAVPFSSSSKNRETEGAEPFVSTDVRNQKLRAGPCPGAYNPARDVQT
ncbi:hypothetical protein ACIQPT_25520 [Streptomyces sp. NPDC091289]|uniref:hypothetical protein n=1 Tax=Streptomyces sp. NPDC091289 TaxID=3365989 RepID=UPI0037F2DD23